MNKKIAAALCVLTVIVCVVFFVSKGKDEDNSDAVIVITTTEETKEETSSKKQKDVKLTLPISVIPEEYQNDLEGYRELHGYESVKKDINGNVKIKMSALSYGLLQTQIGINVINSVYEIADKKENSYIKEVSFLDTENFEKITVTVNAEKYKSNDKDALYDMAMSCFYYQMFSEKPDYKCDITVIDAKTGNEIETKNYTE